MNTWETADGTLAMAYDAHATELRGVVRHALVHRALVDHAPTPRRVLDVGGGSGTQARLLARKGHEVTLLDPDPAMIDRARAAVDEESDEVRARIHLVHGSGEDAADLVGGDWDLVCCHGVLMYLPDPAPLLSALVDLTGDGGVLSVLAKNAAALSWRAALERRWADALALLDVDTETGNLAVDSRGDHLDALIAQLGELGAPVTAWYGVRVATDHLGDTPPGSDRDQAIALEWEFGRRDPYRRCARLLHLIATKTGTAA